jgi:uncharacterized protein with WD repeat
MICTFLREVPTLPLGNVLVRILPTVRLDNRIVNIGTAKQEDGNATKNFKIWRTESGELVHAFVQKNINPLNFQYTYDEKYCARAVTNEIQFFESDKLNTGESYW